MSYDISKTEWICFVCKNKETMKESVRKILKQSIKNIYWKIEL